MAINLILVLRGNVVGYLPISNGAWWLARAAEDAGFKVYMYRDEGDSVAECGEYGWKYVAYPPEVVSLAVMINN